MGALTRDARMELRAAIERAVAADPGASSRRIAAALGTHVSTVIRYRRLLSGEQTVDGELVYAPVPAQLCRCETPVRNGDSCLFCGHDLGLARLVVC